MGLLSRNIAVVVALVVVLHLASTVPLNKDNGNGNGKGRGGKKGLTDDIAADYSSLLDAFAEAHGQEETADFVLAEQGREKRDADEPSELVSADGGYESDALVADDGPMSALAEKKPCRRNGTPSGGNSTSSGGDDASESEDMARQQKKGSNNRKKGSKGKRTGTDAPSELRSFFADADFPNIDW